MYARDTKLVPNLNIFEKATIVLFSQLSDKVIGTVIFLTSSVNIPEPHIFLVLHKITVSSIIIYLI